MKKLALGLAALLSSFGLTSSAMAASVEMFFSGQFFYQTTTGPQGSTLKNYIGCGPFCDWQLTVTLPDIAGPQFATQSGNLYLNGADYAISGRLNAAYNPTFPHDLLTFTGDGINVPVPGMAGDELLYFNFTFELPLGTLLQSRQTPPTDANLYLNGLLPGSRAYASFINFPGAGNPLSELHLESYDPRFPPEYPLNDFYASGAFSAAGVPEPASWALLISGFGFAGAAVRRRKTVRVSVAA